jgi:hypothetical protein
MICQAHRAQGDRRRGRADPGLPVRRPLGRQAICCVRCRRSRMRMDDYRRLRRGLCELRPAVRRGRRGCGRGRRAGPLGECARGRATTGTSCSYTAAGGAWGPRAATSSSRTAKSKAAWPGPGARRGLSTRAGARSRPRWTTPSWLTAGPDGRRGAFRRPRRGLSRRGAGRLDPAHPPRFGHAARDRRRGVPPSST